VVGVSVVRTEERPASEGGPYKGWLGKQPFEAGGESHGVRIGMGGLWNFRAGVGECLDWRIGQ
jgi:hypothetical protein